MHIGGGPSRGLRRAAGGLAAESRHLHHGEKTPSVRSVRPAGAAPEASRRRGAPFHSLSGVCFWPPGLIGFHVCVLFDNRNVLVPFEFVIVPCSGAKDPSSTPRAAGDGLRVPGLLTAPHTASPLGTRPPRGRTGKRGPGSSLSLLPSLYSKNLISSSMCLNLAHS